MLGTQPVEHGRSKLPHGLEQVVGFLFLNDAGVVVEIRMLQLGTFREVNRGRLVLRARV